MEKSKNKPTNNKSQTTATKKREKDELTICWPIDKDDSI
jgi:hypothetical protein